MKLLFFIFISFWLIFCDQKVINDRASDSAGFSNPGSGQLEICSDSQQCSSGIDCPQGETCINSLCEYPICVSRTEACRAACGSSDCSILESDPSSVACKK